MSYGDPEVVMRRVATFAAAGVLLVTASGEALAEKASLKGSRTAMIQQNTVAKEHGLAFYRTSEEIRDGVERGDLAELKGDENYDVASFVSHPYVQPAALVFVEMLSADYRAACGEKLVVTSAVRPSSAQPSNAHELSVHPAGMALDLRVSGRAECRTWIESRMLELESAGLINGIREYRPPHYHVAIFPGPFMAYAEERLREQHAAAARAGTGAAAAVLAAGSAARPLPPVDQTEGATPARRTGMAAVLALMLAVPFGRVAWRRRRRDDAVWPEATGTAARPSS
jgi:hypothetical protein